MHTLILFFSFMLLLIADQEPISKISENKSTYINYKRATTSSRLKLNSILSKQLINRVENDNSFKPFFDSCTNESLTYVSSLLILRVGNGKINYCNAPLKKDFPLDFILNNFLKKNITIDSFEKRATSESFHEIGVFCVYDAQTSIFEMEFAEIKANKYYRISKRLIKKINGVSKANIINHHHDTVRE